MTRYYIYRTNHVAGRQPLSVEWSDSAENALAQFIARQESVGDFVAEAKSRAVNWWLY